MVIYLALHWSKLVKLFSGVNCKIRNMKKKELAIKEVMKKVSSCMYIDSMSLDNILLNHMSLNTCVLCLAFSGTPKMIH